MINETAEQLAKIVGEMRETVCEKLEGMETEGDTCIPIEDVRIMLIEQTTVHEKKDGDPRAAANDSLTLRSITVHAACNT